jgi:hypothetical protein
MEIGEEFFGKNWPQVLIVAAVDWGGKQYQISSRCSYTQSKPRRCAWPDIPVVLVF